MRFGINGLNDLTGLDTIMLFRTSDGGENRLEKDRHDAVGRSKFGRA